MMGSAPACSMLLVDGNSLIHRAFHALPLLTNSKGQVTNAAYGFTTMFLKLIEKMQPEYVAVAFDRGKATFRTSRYENYKAHRPETAADLRPQFAFVQQILAAMRIAVLELEGYEADDIIGTLAQVASEQGLAGITIVTGDRDLLQLVNSKVNVMLTKKGISQMDLFDLPAVQARYGLQPVQLVDVKGLMGDASDNIPGVPGIGEKTALKMVQEYGSLEAVIANIHLLKGKKIGDILHQHEDQARLSKELARICCTVPLAVELALLACQPVDSDQLRAVFSQLGFNSLLSSVRIDERHQREDQYGPQPEQNNSVQDNRQYQLISNWQQLTEVCQAATAAGNIGLTLLLGSADYLRCPVEAVGIAVQHRAWGLCPTSLGSSWEQVLHSLAPVLTDPAVAVNLHDAKLVQAVLSRLGIQLEGLTADTMVAAYLLNPSAGDFSLANLTQLYLGYQYQPAGDLALDAAHSAALTWDLAQVLEERLRQVEMLPLYQEVELPLTSALALMELEGIKVDGAQLAVMGRELEEVLQWLTAAIHSCAGEEFNINSTKQLATILFEKLQLPAGRKTKTGYSTSAQVLEELACEHQIVAQVLEYRQLMKLKSTYVEGLSNLIDPDTGKLHTTFHQTITATGRLSSSEPNLQNIPIRLEVGRRLRKAFLPSTPDRLLVAADYSQIELRVLAHISGDPVLQAAFCSGEDIHTRTAAEIFGVPIDQVTADLRHRAKAVNFGIVYGISDFGLARDLGVKHDEARAYIQQYFRRYQGVEAWMRQVVIDARERGFVQTLLNRRRYLPDLRSPNRNVKQFGERTALNTPIQGSAADIIKLAMIAVFRQLRQQKMQARLILQVHDELILDTPRAEIETVVSLLKSAMETAYPLQVPLTVDVEVGPNWYDLQPYEEADYA